MKAGSSSTSRREAGRFTVRYGAWALVAGASQGLGAAFARSLAARGMSVVLVARRRPLLEKLAAEVRESYRVQVRCIEGDLSSPAFLSTLPSSVSDLDVGLLVYNAAHAPVGPFADVPEQDLLRAVDVNVRGPVALLRALLPPMVARKRGAIVLMTSLAGNQGSPRLATYASSKAFLRVLAESLWAESRGQGIDVVACCAGAIRTPGYASTAARDAPGTLNPEVVVERALRALGRGPVVIPGLVNRAAAFLLGRVLPRRAAIAIMAGSTGSLSPAKQPKGGS